MKPWFDIACFGFAAQVSLKNRRMATGCAKFGTNAGLHITKNSFHSTPAQTCSSFYFMPNNAVGHIIVVYHIFWGIMSTSMAVISACFSYLSDYLQIKRKHTHFKPIFAIFNHGCCTFNHGCCTFNHGCRTFFRGCRTFFRGCWNYFRGCYTFFRGCRTFFRGCYTFFRGSKTVNLMRFILKHTYCFCNHSFNNCNRIGSVSKSGKPFSYSGFT